MKEKEGQSHYDFVKDFNTFMYNQTLHRDRKHFCHRFLLSFSTEKILERHVNDWFEINGKQMIKMAEIGEKENKKKNKIKIKSPFMIYDNLKVF